MTTSQVVGRRPRSEPWLNFWKQRYDLLLWIRSKLKSVGNLLGPFYCGKYWLFLISRPLSLFHGFNLMLQESGSGKEYYHQKAWSSVYLVISFIVTQCNRETFATGLVNLNFYWKSIFHRLIP